MSLYDQVRRAVENNRDTITHTALGSLIGTAAEHVARATPIVGWFVPAGWGGFLGGIIGATMGMSNDAQRKRLREAQECLTTVLQRPQV